MDNPSDYFSSARYQPRDNESLFRELQVGIGRIVDYHQSWNDVTAQSFDDMTDRQKFLISSKLQTLEYQSESVCRRAFGTPPSNIDFATWARSIGIHTLGLMMTRYRFKPSLSDTLAVATTRGFTFCNRFHGVILDIGYDDDLAVEFAKHFYFGVVEARFRARYPGWSYELLNWETEHISHGGAPCIFYRHDFAGLGLPNHLEFMLTKIADWSYRNSSFIIPAMLEDSPNHLKRAEIKALIGNPPKNPDELTRKINISEKGGAI